MSDFDMDSILDSALDEFDRKEPARPAPAPAPNPQPPQSINQSINQSANNNQQTPDLSSLLAALTSIDPSAASGDESFDMKEFSRAFAALAGGDGSNGEPDLNQLAQMLEQAAKAEASHPSSQSTLASAPASQPVTPSVAPAKEENLDFKDSVNRALRMINEQEGTNNNQSSAAPGMDAGMDEMLSKLLAEFQGEAGGEPNDILEKMMGHMLSREYLYQPMLDIANSYPAWIEERKSTLSEEDLKNYQSQHRCFQRIVAIYEEKRSSEDESKAVMEIMNEMQQYGTPPQELVQDMLPPSAMANMTGSDASSSASGMPEIPGFDEAAINEMMKGLSASGGPPEECRTQ